MMMLTLNHELTLLSLGKIRFCYAVDMSCICFHFLLSMFMQFQDNWIITCAISGIYFSIFRLRELWFSMMIAPNHPSGTCLNCK